MSDKQVTLMGIFARYLTLWVALCIVAGIMLGHIFPPLFAALAGLEVQHVNLLVALLVWLMIVPMLLKVDFAQLAGVRQQVRGIGVTLLVNWAIKPFSMTLLGWLFVRHVFAAWLPTGEQDAYIPSGPVPEQARTEISVSANRGR